MNEQPRDRDDPRDDEGGTAEERSGEAAKPSDIGALDGAAAAGSPVTGTDPDDDGGVPTSPPDPTVGPD